MRLMHAAVLLLSALVPGVHAMEAERCVASIDGGQAQRLAGYCYEEAVLNGAAEDATLPLLVVLPSMGSTPSEYLGLLAGLENPVRLVLVQGRHRFREGYSFYPVAPRNYYRLDADAKRDVVLEEAGRLSAFVAAIAERHAPHRAPLMTGASQGGDLSYAIAVRHPGTIAAAFPLLATVDERILLAAGSGAPKIRVLHGEEDPIVPITGAQSHVDALRRVGFDATLGRYPGLGHDVAGDLLRDLLALIDRDLAGRTEKEGRD